MLTLSSYIKTLKKYANNISISDEDFVRSMFEYVVDALDIKNSKNEPYDFKKSRISGILNQKEDVPTAIRNAICHYNSKSKLESAFSDFLDDCLNQSKMDALVKDVKELLLEDDTFSKSVVKTFCDLDNYNFLTTTFIESVKANNLIEYKEKKLWTHGDNSLALLTGDIIDIAFDKKDGKTRIVVIPVNTAFDTYLSKNIEEDIYPLVSKETVHGKWLLRILREIDKETLDTRIEKYLRQAEIKPVGVRAGICGKDNIYSIGTTVIIQHKNTVFYLLAIANFDAKNMARSSESFVKKSIEDLLDYYDSKGMGYDMYLPLIGTGRSRANLSFQESYDLIKKTLMDNKNKIQGKISIVVLTETVGKIKNF